MLLFTFQISNAQEQSVYERGTFSSVPSGKHINHSFYGVWNAYFAVEDGVLVFDHHNQKWIDPITASNGLIQYPALMVWENPDTRDVWIVTPDYVFIYDHLSDWMTRYPLPRDSEFSGEYELGITNSHVIISAQGSGQDEVHSAMFKRNLMSFETWGANSVLGIDNEDILKIPSIGPEFLDLYNSLPLQILEDGGFDANGSVHLNNYPQKSASEISSLTGNSSMGEVFLGTYGAGIFYQSVRSGNFRPLHFGLLSPDIMCLYQLDGKLAIGGRAGLTILNGYEAEYIEAIREVVLDYSFVSAFDKNASGTFIAGRGGVFKKDIGKSAWNRLVSKLDMGSTRIYSIAAGSDGNIMIATERNAFLYSESGLILQTLFSTDFNWPVFDIKYLEGDYYLSTYSGLFIFDETTLTFSSRVNSSGELVEPNGMVAIDPIYESIVVDSVMWASTHRGLMSIDLNHQEGHHYLSPQTPFKPRGLAVEGDRVWLGSDVGLFSFGITDMAWRQYTRGDGLISDFVTDLVADKDYIWLGTNLGLTRIKWQNLY